MLFLEPKLLYRALKDDVPEDYYSVELGTLRSVREGGDVTVFCYGAMVPVAVKAAGRAAEKLSLIHI